MKVLLLSKYPRMGASSRLRSLQYLPALARDDIEVTVSSLFDVDYLKTLYAEGRRPKLRSLTRYLKRLFVLFKAFRYDVVWIEKEIFPYLPAICERLMAFVGVRYVVDYDDAIFHNYDLASNILVRKLLGQKIDSVMVHADCVIAGNQYLADRARRAGAKRVEIIPTVVDHMRYANTDREVGNQLVVGWIGSPSTQRYVVDIRDALRSVCDKTGAKLVMVGATNEVLGQLAGIPVEVVPWSENSEADSIAKMDVGIMPLVDGPWEKGKCGYKLIQYMASGIPVVASPVGVNVDMVNSNQCGYLAESSDEWATALVKILSSKAMQSRLGAAGRKAVEQRYSLHSQAPSLAKVFRTVAQSNAS